MSGDQVGFLLRERVNTCPFAPFKAISKTRLSAKNRHLEEKFHFFLLFERKRFRCFSKKSEVFREKDRTLFRKRTACFPGFPAGMPEKEAIARPELLFYSSKTVEKLFENPGMTRREEQKRIDDMSVFSSFQLHFL